MGNRLSRKRKSRRARRKTEETIKTPQVDRLTVDEQIQSMTDDYYYFKWARGDLVPEWAKTTLNQSCSVLEIGCQTGCWCMEVATEYPHANLFGLDINSYFPTTVKPVNCNFLQIDLDGPIQLPDASMDYVRLSNMSIWIPQAKYESILQECVRLLKSEGIFEWTAVLADHAIQDFQPQRVGPVQEAMNQKMVSFYQSNHYNPLIAKDMQRLLCQNHHLTIITPPNGAFISVPVGDWGGKIGAAAADRMSVYFKSIKADFLDYLRQVHHSAGMASPDASPLSIASPAISWETMTSEDYDRYCSIWFEEANHYRTYTNLYALSSMKSGS
ncbi:hypothetical protein BZG36_05257 [Bifiguratus adelaidae]|uniref:Methyltransferase domain-containing protein n=1 Tax=Bifiguratus adelaidae TaxID=1938954 RepID=A0A261XTV7_9FUNG|nr:hypothetical protein BZG36_05257 [Bifiguratus adelaidae]